jgi:hypothetical protein
MASLSNADLAPIEVSVPTHPNPTQSTPVYLGSNLPCTQHPHSASPTQQPNPQLHIMPAQILAPMPSPDNSLIAQPSPSRSYLKWILMTIVIYLLLAFLVCCDYTWWTMLTTLSMLL